MSAIDGFLFARAANADRDAAATSTYADAIIARLERERNDAQRECIRLREALAIEQSHSAGLLAQYKTVKLALTKVAPLDALLQATGRIFRKSGTAEIGASLPYEEAFDRKAASLGLDPKTIRAKAD